MLEIIKLLQSRNICVSFANSNEDDSCLVTVTNRANRRSRSAYIFTSIEEKFNKRVFEIVDKISKQII